MTERANPVALYNLECPDLGLRGCGYSLHPHIFQNKTGDVLHVFCSNVYYFAVIYVFVSPMKLKSYKSRS